MLSKNTIRNIHKKDFEQFFRKYKVKNRTRRIIPEAGEERYSAIARLIREELSSGDSFNSEDLDMLLFNQLFYEINNWHYVYKNNDINSIFLSENIHEVEAYLQKYEALNFNKLIIDDIYGNEFQLCTTRLENVNDKIRSINFLFKVGVSVSSEDNYNFFCSITIDLESNLVIIRFNNALLENFPKDPLDVISKLRDILNGASGLYSFFDDFQFNVIGLNEEAPKNLISSLFKELSSEAEELLNEEVPSNTVNDIREFLEGKGLPSEEDYIQQIKSVIYQDISQKAADTLFINGWVFRFVFREGQLTRASSRTDNKSPIYGSKVYWHLKELIFKSNEMKEAGFHWYLEDPTLTDDPDFVIVRLEARNDSLIIHYYYKMRSNRKEKEDYVLQKINRYI